MTTQDSGGDISGWVVGGWVFAASVMIMVGMFQAIAGFTAILDDDFYVVAENYTFDLDTTAWGWVHLIIGAIVFMGGLSLLAGAVWAQVLAITLAVISAVSNFFFIPYYPFWSIVIIALNIWVIWALTRPGLRAGTE